MAGLACNLGLLAMARGNAARSRRYLEQAESLCREAAFIRLSVLDNFAQLALFEDDSDACRRNIDECAAVIASQELPARSWYDFAHQITRCAHLETREAWTDIVTIVEEADEELARRQFRSLRADLLSAKARALAALGRHTAADAALAGALRTCPRGAAEPLITWESAKAVCLSRRGQHAQASIHFDRALSACRAIGAKHQEHTVTRYLRQAEHVHESVPVPLRAIDASDLNLRLEDVTTILRAGHSVDILVHRAVALLEGTPLRARVTVDSESGCDYAPEPFSTFESRADGTCAITVRGSDRRVTITFANVESLDDIALVKNIADLVQAGMVRTAAAQSDEDDLELWPTTAEPSDEDVVFRSPRMVELLRVALRLAATPLPILITGETGTGKEVIARLIHDHSLVKRGPFVAFNCSALPRELVESQLFGHRRGAFTGAVDSFPGVIRSAERGTLFLDEIGDLDAGVQPKLLRFLEQAEVQPVGESRPHKVSVRVVAATNADLDRLADEGRLRRDLYYRLGVARIALPSLRERKDEIPALASLLVARYAREFGRANLTIGDDLMAALLLYDWPGNIRQLANELRRLVAMAENGQALRSAGLDPEISRRLLETQIVPTATPADAVPIRLDQTLDRAIEELERAFITRAMNASNGRVAEAAQLLGLSRKGLFLKRRRWGMAK
jgi:DNA-binding NtrC family response regulator